MEKLLVYNIEPATHEMLRALNRHCLHRSAEGVSAIDPGRSHLNEILVGKEAGSVLGALDELYKSGVKKPTKQALAPYLRIVVSASPAYFRPDNPEAVGSWDDEKLELWKEATLAQLEKEHGKDLIYAELHLDEDTPHIHAVVAPTYTRKPRVPGKKRKSETVEEFEERRAVAQASNGVRTVGRASHETLSKINSFQKLRERMSFAVAHLGIEYGDDRSLAPGQGQTTREWIKSEALRNRKDRKELEDLAEQRRAEESAFDALAIERAQALKWQREKLDSERAALADEASRLDAHRSELADEASRLLGAKIDIARREKVLAEISRGVLKLVRDIGAAAGVRLPDSTTDALRRLRQWVDEMRNRPEELAVRVPEDPFSRPPEEPVEETGPGPGF